MNPAEKVHARVQRFDEEFLRMKHKVQMSFEKCADLWNELGQIGSTFTQNDKIISITGVVFDLKFSFHELVKLVHVDVHEQLAREIPKRQANIVLAFCFETIDDLTEQPQNIGILYVLGQNVFQNGMIDICKELSDVAFKNPDRIRVIA